MRLRCALIKYPPRWITLHWLRSDFYLQVGRFVLLTEPR